MFMNRLRLKQLFCKLMRCARGLTTKELCEVCGLKENILYRWQSGGAITKANYSKLSTALDWVPEAVEVKEIG